MAFALLDSDFVITAVNDEYVAQVMSRKGSVGSKFVEVFEEPDQETISGALARAADGGMEEVPGVSLFSCGPGPNDFPQNVVYNWTILKHGNSGFLAAAAPVARTTGASSWEAEELKDFFNKAPIALHWLSSNGKVLWANDRELEVLGYSREEYIGADIMDFCPDSKEGVLEIFKQLGTGNTIRDVPVRFRTKAGKVQDLLIDSNVNYKSDGSFNHTRCFIRDDTGRILREARAESAATAAIKLAREKERFSSKLLHNIKTPLHVMSMSLSDPASVDVPVLLSQLRSLSGLCASVVQAMKFDDAYFITPLPTPIDLPALIREYRKVEGLRHKVVVERIGFAKSLVVLADGKMIRTVLDELVAHADGRSPAGASIRLSVERKRGRNERGEEEDQFEFRVANSGEKLDESRVEKMFHQYWLGGEDELPTKEPTSEPTEEKHGSRPSSSVSEQPPSESGKLLAWNEDAEHGSRPSSSVSGQPRSESGELLAWDEDALGDEALGLRLNVAFNYVQCLDSILGVISDASTTTFKFSLSLKISDVQKEARAPVKRAKHSWKKIGELPPIGTPAVSKLSPLPSLDAGIFPKHPPGVGIYGFEHKHVLIVEDNTICQKMCKRIVKNLGHTADTADNGAIAVEMATKQDVNIYDLVLMDIRMPVMDGIVAALKIRDVFPELPIVAFSAEESDQIQAEALDVMVGFIKKPADSKVVERTIREHARRRL